MTRVIQLTSLSIPSPSDGVWNLGPLPLRGYALCIILGIIAAIWIGERRWVARGGKPGEVSDLAVWAVPFGLVGGRLYHVITDYQLYFGGDNNPGVSFFSLDTHAWTSIDPGLGAHYGASGIVDAARGRALFFSGGSGMSAVNTTWAVALDTQAISELTPGTRTTTTSCRSSR